MAHRIFPAAIEKSEDKKETFVDFEMRKWFNKDNEKPFDASNRNEIESNQLILILFVSPHLRRSMEPESFSSCCCCCPIDFSS